MNSSSASSVSNPLIDQLVRERTQSQTIESGQQLPGSPKISQQQRHWAKLAHEPIYLLKLTVKVGAQSLRLDGSHLGINETVLRLLEDTASGGYAAKISKRLKDAANKLQARQKIIYNRYTVLSEPFRLVHESSLPKALEAIEEMLTEADTLREEILEAYEEEYASFLQWAYLVLSEAALELDEIESALRQYAEAYPTKEDLQENSLRVLVEGPVKIPSLIEESKREAELAQQQAAQEAVEVERQKLRVLQRSQETLQQTLLSTLYDVQVRSRDEAHSKLAQLLESFSLDGPDATSRTGQKWDTLISRLEVLAQYDPNLEPIVKSAGQIQRLYLSEKPNLETVQRLLEDFRAFLKERVSQDATGAGSANLTKALALDSGYSDLLLQLDAIATCPDPEQLRELKGKLASMENLFKFRTKDLQKRWSMAENAVRKSLGLDQITKLQAIDTGDNDKPMPATVTSTTEPYDPEAGF